MKTTTQFLMYLAFISAGVANQGVSQDAWETTYIGRESSQILGLATDGEGRVVALQGISGTGTVLLVSANGGGDWVPSPPVPAGGWCRMAMSDHGQVYLANAAGKVIRSSDLGGSWEDVWSLPDGGGFNTLHALETTSGDQVFAAVDIKPAWMLAKGVPAMGADAPMVWEFVDIYSPDPKIVAEPTCIAVDRGAGVDGADILYVGGWQNHWSQGISWVLRKSSDGGNTWSTINQYQIVRGAGLGDGLYKIAVGPDGTLYAAGQLTTAMIKTKGNIEYVRPWLLRRSVDGGFSWTTVLERASDMTDLMVDSNGAVLVSYLNSVEASADRGETWRVSDSFNSYTECLVLDAFGNYHAGGATQVETGAWMSLIRSLNANQP